MKTMRKKILMILSVVLISLSLKAQISWVHDMSMAQSIALSTQKLIVVDFWATWCTPCMDMDMRLWQSEEVKVYRNSAVFLKINIDNNMELMRKYNVRSIPTVMVISPCGDKLWENVGYRSNMACVNLLKSIPEDVAPIIEPIAAIIEENETAQDLMALGRGYQKLGKNQGHVGLKRAFLSEADNYIKKSGKKEEALKTESELLLVLNLIYRNKVKTAEKKLQKIQIDESNQMLLDLKNLILAYCCKANKDESGYQTACSNIKNKQLITEL